MSPFYRILLCIAIAAIIAAGVLLCRLFPARPVAAAPSLAATWTPQGALIAWPAGDTITLERCRPGAYCLLLTSGSQATYLDDGAQAGDTYRLGRFQVDERLTIIGWETTRLTGGRVWFPVAGR